jgi:CrcB protein
MAGVGAIMAVAAGGAIGSVARFVIGRWVGATLGPAFPWGTLAVNVLGGVAMGVLAVLLLERMPAGAARWAPFAMTGVLGGFTTFSAFALDAVTLIERGEAARAALYVAASVGFSVGGLWLGLTAARAL